MAAARCAPQRATRATACAPTPARCTSSQAVKRRTGRDWGKMTDADWDEIEKEWETPEEAEEYAFKPPTPKVVRELPTRDAHRRMRAAVA